MKKVGVIIKHPFQAMNANVKCLCSWGLKLLHYQNSINLINSKTDE